MNVILKLIKYKKKMLKELPTTDNTSPTADHCGRDHCCGGCGRSIRDRYVFIICYTMSPYMCVYVMASDFFFVIISNVLLRKIVVFHYFFQILLIGCWSILAWPMFAMLTLFLGKPSISILWKFIWTNLKNIWFLVFFLLVFRSQPLDSELSCFSRDGNIYCKEDYYR